MQIARTPGRLRRGSAVVVAALTALSVTALAQEPREPGAAAPGRAAKAAQRGAARANPAAPEAGAGAAPQPRALVAAPAEARRRIGATSIAPKSPAPRTQARLAAEEEAPAAPPQALAGGAVLVPSRDVSVVIEPDGAVAFSPAGEERTEEHLARFRLLSLLRGAVETPLHEPSAPSVRGGRASVDHGGVVEVYEARRMGVEQLFEIAALPEGEGDLSLTARLDGGLYASIASPGCPLELCDVAGRALLSYGVPAAIDAAGARIECGLEVTGALLRITIPEAWARAAALPITIDPLIGTAVTVANSTTVRERRPEVAYSATSDSYIVVWETETAAGDHDILARRYNVTGTGTPTPSLIDVSGPLTLASGANNTVEPAVAWLGGNGVDRFLVTWADRTTNRALGAMVAPRTTGASAVTPLAVPIASATFATTAGDTYNVVSRTAVGGALDGLGWVVFIQANSTFAPFDTDILGVTVSASGAVGGIHLVGSTDNGVDFVNDSLASVNKVCAVGSEWMMLWESSFAATDHDIFFFTVDKTGAGHFSFFTTAGQQIPLEGSGDMEEHPAVDGLGPDWLVAFQDTFGGDRDLLLERFRLGGLFPGGPFDLAVGATDDGEASIGFANTDYLVSWMRAAAAGGATGTAELARIDVGSFSQREFAVPFGTANRAADLAVTGRNLAGAGKPEFLVAYAERAPGSPLANDFDLFAQKVEGSADPVMVVHESSATGQIVANSSQPDGRRDFFRQAPATGTSEPSRFVIENRGGSDLVLSSPTLTNTTDFQLDTTGFLATVPAGSNTSFTATFKPATAGTKTGQIRFTFGGGTLTSATFTMNVIGEAVAGITFALTTTARAIPDFTTAPGVATSSVVVTTPGVVLSARVLNMNIRHANMEDLDVELVSPSGATALLATQVGGSSAGFFDTSFDDSAALGIAVVSPPFTGVFQPDGFLSDVVGTSAQGTWTLRATDFTAGNVGTILSWSLELETTTSPIMQVFEGAGTLNTQLASNAPAAGLRVFPAQPITGATPGEVTITLENTGFSPLSVTSGPQLVPANASFTIVPGSLTSITSNATASFKVRFTPATPGLKTGTIQFTHNDPAAPNPFVINVKGFAFDPATAVQSAFPCVEGLPRIIPDPPFSALPTVIHCPAQGQVISVSVTAITLRHTFLSDLTVTLTSPSGTSVLLMDGASGTSEDDMIGASFQDGAGSLGVGPGPFAGAFAPEEPLAAFAGEGASGDWTLEIADNFNGDDGVIEAWTLAIRTTAAPGAPYMVVRRGSASGPIMNNGDQDGFREDMGFGIVGAGAPPARTYVVQNAGGGTLDVAAATVTPGAASGDFTLSSTAHSLAAGQSATFTLSFTPATTGVVSGAIALSHTGGAATPSPYAFDVTGIGAGGVVVTQATGPFPKTIADGATVTSIATVATSGSVVGVTLTMNITHDLVSDLQISLEHAGRTVFLFDQDADGGEDFTGTVFSDGANTQIVLAGTPFTGSFRPEGLGGGPSQLATFDGAQAAGDWTLRVADLDLNGSTGRIDSWSIEVGTEAAPVIEVRRGGATGAVMSSGELASGAFAFGDRQTNLGSARATVFISNGGSAVLDLSNLTIVGNSQFTLSPATFPGTGGTRQLLVGTSTTFDVVFTPSAGQIDVPAAATVQFAHTDASQPSPFLVNVTGKAKRPTLISGSGSGGSGGGGGGCSAGGSADTSTPALLAAALALYAASRARRGVAA